MSNNIISDFQLIEIQALISNAMQAIDDGHENFAQTCLNRAYDITQQLIERK